ncbi:MAG: hypothetical protein MJ070_04565 [Lachnospiraceae bacterium]|nr:hypothetical protein [Lachnospiraceae bacterium]
MIQQNDCKAYADYQSARFSMLFYFIIGIVTPLLMRFLSTLFFVSPFYSYALGIFGMALEEETGSPGIFFLFAALSAAISVIYLLSFLFSKKMRSWLVAGTVAYAIDTAGMIGFLILFFEPDLLIDLLGMIVFHFIELGIMIYALMKCKTVPEKPVPEAMRTVPDGEAPIDDALFVRTVTVERPKNFVGSLVTFYFFVGGKNLASVKNGKTVSFRIPAGECVLLITGSVKKDGSMNPNAYWNEFPIPAGETDVSYTVSMKQDGNTFAFLLEPKQ